MACHTSRGLSPVTWPVTHQVETLPAPHDVEVGMKLQATVPLVCVLCGRNKSKVAGKVVGSSLFLRWLLPTQPRLDDSHYTSPPVPAQERPAPGTWYLSPVCLSRTSKPLAMYEGVQQAQATAASLWGTVMSQMAPFTSCPPLPVATVLQITTCC